MVIGFKAGIRGCLRTVLPWMSGIDILAVRIGAQGAQVDRWRISGLTQAPIANRPAGQDQRRIGRAVRLARSVMSRNIIRGESASVDSHLLQPSIEPTIARIGPDIPDQPVKASRADAKRPGIIGPVTKHSQRRHQLSVHLEGGRGAIVSPDDVMPNAGADDPPADGIVI